MYVFLNALKRAKDKVALKLADGSSGVPSMPYENLWNYPTINHYILKFKGKENGLPRVTAQIVNNSKRYWYDELWNSTISNGIALNIVKILLFHNSVT